MFLKIVERIVHNRLYEFVIKNEILCSSYSAEHAILEGLTVFQFFLKK